MSQLTTAAVATRRPQTRGRSRLPLIELDRGTVARPRARIVRRGGWPLNPSAIATTTLGYANSELVIAEWAFYHAAAKSELAASFQQVDVDRHARGYRLLMQSLLAWAPDNLRLQQGGVFSRKDAPRAAHASRVGEAVLFLFMLKNGYIYWDHVPSLVERAMNRIQIDHDEQVRRARAVASRLRRHGEPAKQPDFAFETEGRQVALAEAKGSFVEPCSAARSIKSDLSYGLAQLTAWQDFISPRPSKAYAVGTYLREVGDAFPDPSLVAFVDPTDDEPPSEDAIRFQPDWIRRGNYAAWLVGMGLTEAAVLLRTGNTADLPVRRLPVVSVGRQRFVMMSLDWPSFMPWPAVRWLLLPRSLIEGIYVIGLELSRTRAIERAIHAADADLSMLISASKEGIVLDDKEDVEPWFSGSIMPDGSLFGTVHGGDSAVVFDTEGFRL